MLRFEDVLARILALAEGAPGSMLVDLEDADGRVLAEDLVAEQGLPLDDTIGADGYAGDNVRRRGDDLDAGAVALARGTRLRPAHLALAAALERRQVLVSARPSVTVLAIGEPDALPFALRASARKAGANVRAWPAIANERSAIERAFANALAQSDVLVTVSSSARAEDDLVGQSLLAVGAQLDRWNVAVKPGRTLGVGSWPRDGRSDGVVLGLSGNPAGALVTFGLFGIPLLRALQGDAHPFPAFARARMTRAHAHDPGLLELARASLTQAEQGYAVTTLGSQAGGSLLGMARADALVCIPESATGAHAGDEVDILLLSDLCG